jgi:4-diphosphocytidyl-2-C-methyl-D-erythritol kinase
MTAVARVGAQAKLNLFLRVLARETSGYHQIETLFCRLALADDVTVRVGTRTRSLECTGAIPSEGLGPVEQNLAWRAAVAYAEMASWPDGFAIEIEKRIPVGGGLGGGSADAGAVLRAFEALSPSPLGHDRVLELAASIGADVPFLASDAALALAWGRGERMLALKPLSEAPVILLAFRQGVSTKEAYEWLAESRRIVRPMTASIIPRRTLSRWEGISALAHNDFEPVVRARHALVDEVLTRFRGDDGRELFGDGRLVMMSGSGATVFVVPDRALGDHIAFEVRAPNDDVRWIPTHTASTVVPVELDQYDS